MELSGSINALAVALLDAGIPLTGVPTAVTVAVLQDGSLEVHPKVLDPRRVVSLHTIAFELRSNQVYRILMCESTGKFSKTQFLDAVEAAWNAATEVHKLVRVVVGEKIEKEFVWKQIE